MAIVPVCTKDDLIKEIPETRLAELTDDVDGAAINDGLVTHMISQESSFIYSHLRSRNYILPTTAEAVPLELVRCAVDLLVYRLYKRRDIVDENRKASYDAAREFLESVKDGSVVLDLPMQGEPSPSAVVSSSKPQVFNDAFFAGY